MIAEIIFFSSTVGVCQFGLHYWRATIARVAEQPISDHGLAAVEILKDGTKPRDFRAIVRLANMAPALQGSGDGFKSIRAYYLLIETLARFLPTFANWTENEMVTCSRYAAALLGQRLERNIACAAEIRDF